MIEMILRGVATRNRGGWPVGQFVLTRHGETNASFPTVGMRLRPWQGEGAWLQPP
jgi:hypothetical protein